MIKLFVTKINALEEDHKIGGKSRIKSHLVEKILKGPVPQDQVVEQSFLGIIQSSLKWVK